MSTVTQFQVLEIVSQLCVRAEEVGFTPELLKLLSEDEEFLREVHHAFRFKLRSNDVSVPDLEDNNQLFQNLLNTDLKNFGLSVRTMIALRNCGVRTVRDLVEKSKEEILMMRHIGKNSWREIGKLLVENNLNLSMRFSPNVDTIPFRIIDTGRPPKVD